MHLGIALVRWKVKGRDHRSYCQMIFSDVISIKQYKNFNPQVPVDSRRGQVVG